MRPQPRPRGKRRDEHYPDATVSTDYAETLRRDDVAVMVIVTHPEGRAEQIEAALRAGSHVLSPKPFVLDLGVGERLAALAEARGLKLG